VPYTRASSLSETIDNTWGIHTWEKRLVALGMALRPDLCAEAVRLPPIPMDVQPETAKRDKITRVRLDEIADEAAQAAGRDIKADYGTVFHRLTEPGNGETTPEEMRADIAAFEKCLTDERITILSTEQFVACDELTVAGTFDHHLDVDPESRLGRLIGSDSSVTIGDKKTGQFKPHEWAIQLSIYAHGVPYDWETDTRPHDGTVVNQKWAIVFWAPRRKGICKAVPVDIAEGWRMAQIAAAVRAYHQTTVHVDLGAPKQDPITVLIEKARTVDELRRFWSVYKHGWTDDHTALAKARIAELGGS